MIKWVVFLRNEFEFKEAILIKTGFRNRGGWNLIQIMILIILILVN